MARSSEAWKVVVEGTALATELHSKLNVSHRQAKGLIDSRCVQVNGQEAKTYGIRLHSDDEVKVDFDPERTYTALPHPSKSRDIPFEILWEDKHLVFVNKPAGLLTVPAEKHQDPCLAEAIQDHYRRRGYKRFQLFIAHRLDRYTSGVLVFAKTPEALNGLKNIFAEHHLHRIYKAILVGELPENAGTLSDKLVERKSLKMDVVPEHSHAKHDIKGAKLAVTHYRVLERLPGHTVVEVKLETGRRNQIRVQFAERGFPLLGDQVYGVPSNVINRQALHAELLGFRHPVSEDTVTVSAPIPADMENVLKVLRNMRRVVRAEVGVTGEEGIYKPKITKEQKAIRHERAERFAPEAKAPGKSRPRAEGDAPRARPRPEGAPAARPRTRPEGDAAPRPRTRPGGPAPSRPRPEGASAPRSSRPGVTHSYIHPEAEAPKARTARPSGPRPTGGRPTGPKPAGKHFVKKSR
jgi:23S rRNA pseudouridine1911/1915/1917 synthase